MAIATDRLHTIVTLDAKDYERNADRVAAATRKMKQNGLNPDLMNGLKVDPGQILGTIAKTAAAGIAVLSAAMIGLGVSSLQAYGNLERLTLGLEAVEGSAEIAGKRLKELRELAKAPGLGFEQAVGAFGQLRNAGASTEFAQSLIREIANANARGGGGAVEFGNVMRQVAQTLNRPFLQGEELNTFREAQLPVDRALRSRFGTSDTEELKRQGVTSVMVLTAIVEEFSKMERVQGGFSNAMENLTDTINTSLAQIGAGLAPGVMSIVDQIGTAFGDLTDSGVLKLFGDEISRAGKTVVSALEAGAGGKGLAEVIIELGAAVIDVATILGNAAPYIVAGLQSLPGVGGLIPGLDTLSGGAGGRFKAEALAALARSGTAASGASLDQFTNSVTGTPTTNPVQQRQLAAMEAVQRNTAELVRFEQSALGGGDLLRRGISVSDANRFNAGKGSSSNARDNLVSAIEALIAQNVARGMA